MGIIVTCAAKVDGNYNSKLSAEVGNGMVNMLGRSWVARLRTLAETILLLGQSYGLDSSVKVFSRKPAAAYKIVLTHLIFL